MKLFWTGTDSLMLLDYSMRPFRKKVYWQLFRWFIKRFEIFVQEHYCDSQNIADNLRRFGLKRQIRVVPDRIDERKYDKIPHKGFNVLYYFPYKGDKRFIEWLYGYDIFLQVRERFPDLNYIIVDGTYDMSWIYPVTDFMIRCNRHDGASRIRQECDLNDIPYYWSQTDPDLNKIIDALQEAYTI